MIGWLLPEMGRAGTTVSAFIILAAAGGPCYQAHLDAHVLSLMLIIFFKAYTSAILCQKLILMLMLTCFHTLIDSQIHIGGCHQVVLTLKQTYSFPTFCATLNSPLPQGAAILISMLFQLTICTPFIFHDLIPNGEKADQQ